MSHKNDSFPIKLLWLLLLALIGLVASSCVIFAIPDNPDIIIVKWLQVLQTLLTFAIPTILFWYMYKMKGFFGVPLNVPIWLIAILLMPCSIPAINLTQWLNEMMQLPAFMHGIEEWMKQMEEQTAALTEKFMAVKTPMDFVVNLLVMAIVPAISEEFFFRGGLQKLLTEKFNAHLAIWITAIVFSAIHMQFYGFVPRMLLGAALGYLFWYTGSIWTNICAHFINNALALTFTAFSFKYDLDTIGTKESWWIGVISLCIASALIFTLSKLATSKNGRAGQHWQTTIDSPQ